MGFANSKSNVKTLKSEIKSISIQKSILNSLSSLASQQATYPNRVNSTTSPSNSVSIQTSSNHVDNFVCQGLKS